MSPTTKSASSPVSATICWLTYIVAIPVGIATHLYLDQEYSEYDELLRGLGANIAATTVVFLFSFVFNNTSLYDPYWVLPPPLFALKWVFSGAHNAAVVITSTPKSSSSVADYCGGLNLWAMCAAALVWAWAIRFTVGCPWDGWRTGIKEQDWRYDDMYEKLKAAKVEKFAWWPTSFFSLHLTPTLLVYLALCPLQRAIVDVDVGVKCSPALQVVSLCFTAACIMWQWIADEQLREFREKLQDSQRTNTLEGLKTVVANTNNKIFKKTMRSGLWTYSRHPNYFGEVMFWISIYNMYIDKNRVNFVLIGSRDPWLIAGCVVMAVFFRFASVPLMDERSLKGGRKEEYAQVMEEVSPLMPWHALKSKKEGKQKKE